MQNLPLYRYTDDNGYVIDSLTCPKGEYIERVRLIADDGKLLSKSGQESCPCIDADSDVGWTEIDMPEGYMDDAADAPVAESTETEESDDDGI